MAADGLRETEDNHARNLLRFRIAVALVAAFPILAGCQTGIGVSALNRCGQAVEVNAGSRPSSRGGWEKISPGQIEHVVSVIEDARQIYVDIRFGEGEPVKSFVVSVSTLPKPPPGVDDDVEIVLEGDRCPAAAG